MRDGGLEHRPITTLAYCLESSFGISWRRRGESNAHSGINLNDSKLTTCDAEARRVGSPGAPPVRQPYTYIEANPHRAVFGLYSGGKASILSHSFQYE